jgi:hypothetical protein
MLISFRGAGWAAVDPDGRFDISDLDGGAPLHWFSSEESMRPLPIEIFMRDYYSPGLLSSILNDKSLPFIPSVASLSRVQPTVAVASVRSAGRLPGIVDVDIRVEGRTSSVQRDRRGRFLESGVYDVRLFRDGRMVGQWPDVPEDLAEHAGAIANEADREAWRKTHEVKLDASGRAAITFQHVRLPDRAGVSHAEFVAYAFNRDRVKSLTTPPFDYPLPPSSGRGTPRTAYLVTMGVNANQTRNLNLELAVSSAERVRTLLRAKLGATYSEVVENPLYSEFAADSNQVKEKKARKADLKAVLDLLSDRAVEPGLREEVDPNHQLRAAGPGDAVVLYVASHGYADPQGTFYLMPYDTGSNWGITEDMLTRCASADQSRACVKARARPVCALGFERRSHRVVAPGGRRRDGDDFGFMPFRRGAGQGVSAGAAGRSWIRAIELRQEDADFDRIAAGTNREGGMGDGWRGTDATGGCARSGG